MAPLPPSSTPRFKLLYTNLGIQHSLQIRSHESPATVGAMYDALFDAVGGAIADTTFDSVEFAADGSDIFNPVVTGVEGNTYGISGHPLSDAATFWSVVGRTTGARRVRLYIYGMGGMGVDYRYSAGENPTADGVITVVSGFGSDIVGIDDVAPVFKNYVNAGVNAHLQRALRS